MDGVQHILNAVLHLFHLLFQQGQGSVLLLLQFQYLRNDSINHSIALNQLHGFSHDQIFQPFLTDGLFLAGLGALGVGALIIMVYHLIPACAAFPEHHGSAHSAEQLGSEQIIILGFVVGRCTAILFDFRLYTVEQLPVHNGGDAVGHHNVLEAVLPNVPTVRQQLPDAVVGKLLVAVGGHTAVIQPVHDFLHARTIVVFLE